MSSILNTTALIKTIKRRAFIPKDQRTFSDDDFLEMATEEINIGLMDQLIKARGDYLVYYKDFLIEEDKTHYDIPARAHGNKLRDAKVVDENGYVLHELSQISLEETADEVINHLTKTFYVENNQLVLDPEEYQSDSYLRMYFYMRPNKLVLPARGAIVTAISTTYEVDTVEPATNSIFGILEDGTIQTGDLFGLKVGDRISITGSDSDPSADDDNWTVLSIGDNIFTVDGTFTTPGTTGTWTKLTEVYSITVDAVPSNFSTSIEFDLTGALSPNKIKSFNFEANAINLVSKTITIRTSDITELVVGDYLTQAEETIVPNVPTEYHPIIAQRVAVACLEAMGDEQNKQSAERKLAQMEKAVLSIVTNRVEGAPKKIKNRYGTLNQAINRWGR